MCKKSAEKIVRNANIQKNAPFVVIFISSLFVTTKIIIIFAQI